MDELLGNNQHLCFNSIHIYSTTGVISDKKVNLFKQ